jgi:hypothetical protein
VFECCLEDQQLQVTYDNHGPVEENSDAVKAKFANEDANSFHIALPRFLTLFLIGNFINSISLVMQKGKG